MLNCFDTMDEPWGYYANCNKTEKYKYYMISFICGTWKIKQTSKQNQIHKYIEQIGGYQRAGGLNKLSHFSYVWLFVTLWTVAQPGSSVHGLLQATILEWVSMPFSRESSQTQGSHPGLPHCKQILYHLSYPGQFSHSVVSDSLQRHGLQHARLLRPPLSPRVCSNSYSLSWMNVMIPIISSSVTPPLLLPSIFPSIRIFSNESTLYIRCPKYWSFSFRISLSNEYSGLIPSRIDWFDLLAVQQTLKSLLQHHNLNAMGRLTPNLK